MLLIVVLLCFSCQPYKKKNTNSKDITSSQKEVGQEQLSVSSDMVSSEKEIIQEKPPVSEDLQILLEQAKEMYSWSSMGMDNLEGEPIDTNDNIYYLVKDERFPTYDSWWLYINSIFEKNLLMKI